MRAYRFPVLILSHPFHPEIADEKLLYYGHCFAGNSAVCIRYIIVSPSISVAVITLVIKTVSRKRGILKRTRNHAHALFFVWSPPPVWSTWTCPRTRWRQYRWVAKPRRASAPSRSSTSPGTTWTRTAPPCWWDTRICGFCTWPTTSFCLSLQGIGDSERFQLGDTAKLSYHHTWRHLAGGNGGGRKWGRFLICIFMSTFNLSDFPSSLISSYPAPGETNTIRTGLYFSSILQTCRLFHFFHRSSHFI